MFDKKIKIFSFVTCIILGWNFIFCQDTNWKDTVYSFLKNGYHEKAIQYLNKHYSNINEEDKRVVSLIQSYCYSKLDGKEEQQKNWIQQYFKESNFGKIDVVFLPEKMQEDIQKFMKNIDDQSIVEEKIEKPIFSAEIVEKKLRMEYPENFIQSNDNQNFDFEILIKTSKVCQFILYNEQKNKLLEGKFDIGLNKLRIPFKKNFVEKDKHSYPISFIIEGKENKKIIEINLDYEFPSNLIFDRQRGIIGINGEKFKAEFTKEFKDKQRIAIDGKIIKKSAIPNILFGVAILLAKPQLDRLKDQVNRISIKTSIEGTKILVTTLGIGLIMYGANKIITSVNRKTIYYDIVKPVDNAMENNKKLENEIKPYKNKIILVITSKLKDNYPEEI